MPRDRGSWRVRSRPGASVLPPHLPIPVRGHDLSAAARVLPHPSRWFRLRAPLLRARKSRRKLAAGQSERQPQL